MKYLFLILILIKANVFYAQSEADTVKTKTKITGSVKTENDIPVNNAEVVIKNNQTELKVYSGKDGNFEFSVVPGVYNITIEYSGFNPYEILDYEISSDLDQQLFIILTRRDFTTEEIKVEANLRQSQDDLRTSLFNINPTGVKILPGAIEDVLRSLRSLPGVTAPNDFTSQLVIRGSGPDQNLIIMDDVEIFNPYRLYGLVSMFNPETLSEISLITGGFPSKYGDRLSAVLDVTNREGITDKNFKGLTNINIANANLIFEGQNPFNIPGSWIVSSRRTYYDLIIGPFARKAGLITEDSSFPNFEDLQFKWAFGPFSKHKFFVNGIFSKDAVDIVPGKDRNSPDSVQVNDVTKNDVVSFSWQYFPSTSFATKTTLSWYRNSGDNEFEGDILDPLIDKQNLSPEQRDSLKQIGALLGLNFDSKYFFRKYSLTNKSVYIDKSNRKFEFGAGFDIIRTDLEYKLDLDEQFKAIIRTFPNSQALLENFNLTGNDNYRANIYAQSRFDINKKFYYQPSFRVDYYSLLNKFYFSPRINFGYVIDPLTTIRTSTGLYYQSPGYEKLVDGQTFFDITPEVGKTLDAERSIHIVAGIERWLNNEWLSKFETYYKKFDNLIVQNRVPAEKYEFTLADPTITDPSYISDPSSWVRSQNKIPYDSLTPIPVNLGSGNSYGFEFSLEKKYLSPKTKFYGWVNYSLSFSDRSSYGITKPFRFDQRHVFNIVLNYRVNSWLEIGARWQYATNFPFTFPVGITPRIVNDSLVVNPINRRVIFDLDFGGEANKYTDKKPDYHRLDVRFTAYTRFWETDWSFYIDVINAYNRTNILGYDFYLDNNYEVKYRTVGMIPILPTIGVSARF
ncbi:MAG: TonB-dependent receptor [Ignavibacteria bacterium]|nr:TonB-dependent receptor [Ignavibacteria bacterium]HCN37179.1 hypothetical protein [Bacteroidota bacterium]